MATKTTTAAEKKAAQDRNDVREMSIGQRKSLALLHSNGGGIARDNLPHPNNKRSMQSLVSMKLAVWKPRAQVWVLTAKGKRLAQHVVYLSQPCLS